MDCIGSYGFVPHALVHLTLFYVGTAAAALAWRSGVRWNTELFATSLHIGWHTPLIVTSVPVGVAMLQTALRLLGEDDQARFGELDKFKDLAVTEACVWFGTFLALDTVLIFLHKLAEKPMEMIVHHAIFAAVCSIMFRGCSAPLVGAALIAQELSTPFLNVFLLLRGFRGLESLVTQLAFACFALTFYAVRAVLNTLVTALYVRELYRGFGGGSSQLLYSTGEQLVLGAALLGATALQLYWTKSITQKLLGAIRGEVSQHGGEKTAMLAANGVVDATGGRDASGKPKHE